MLSRKTVFVVGAGASAELGLPIGEGLKPKIVEALKPHREHSNRFYKNKLVESAVFALLEERNGAVTHHGIQETWKAADEIAQALPYAFSIDQYLDAQRDNDLVVRLGKIGIAAAILDAESKSSMGQGHYQSSYGTNREPNLRPPEMTWHLRLVQLIAAGVTPDRLANIFDEVSFIVFNYDRCLEQFLAQALTSLYGRDTGQLWEALRNLHVLHPYGQVGTLPWQSGTGHIPFGGSTENGFPAVAKSLLTFTESADSGMTQDVRRLLQGAETLVFMGFGFLPQNIQLLTSGLRSQASRVLYTTYGISRSDTEFVDEDLEAILGKRAATGIELADDADAFQGYEETGKCIDLMQNNWMRLTR